MRDICPNSECCDKDLPPAVFGLLCSGYADVSHPGKLV